MSRIILLLLIFFCSETLIWRHFADHVVGSQTMKRKEKNTMNDETECSYSKQKQDVVLVERSRYYFSIHDPAVMSTLY